MRWRERLAALDDAVVMAAVERYRRGGEPPLTATLLALRELLGEVPPASAARELGVERALVVRAMHDIETRDASATD